MAIILRIKRKDSFKIKVQYTMLKNLVLSNKLSRTDIIHYIQTKLFVHISKLIPELECVLINVMSTIIPPYHLPS